MASIVRACQTGEVDAEVAVVIAPKAGSPAIETAESLGVPVVVVDAAGKGFAEDLLSELRGRGVGVLCLAGFMRLVPTEVVRAYEGRILNIHPALLPKFGGKGMYGMHVHEAVIAAGETQSGCSVHFVTERYDEGTVLYQLTCAVEPGDTPETLAARVLALEHKAFPAAVQKLIESL